MIPVAVVLVVLVIVFTIAIIIGNPQAFDLQIFVARIPANITGVYVTGAVTMLVLAVAGWLLWNGLVRLRARHKEIKTLKAAAGVRGKALPGKSGSATGTGPKEPKTTGGSKDAAGRAAEPRKSASTDSGAKDSDSKDSDAKDSDAKDSAAKTSDSDPTGTSAAAGLGGSSRGSALDLDDPAGRDTPSTRGSAAEGRDTGGRTASPKDRSGRGGRPEDGETTAEERRRLLDEADELTRDDPNS